MKRLWGLVAGLSVLYLVGGIQRDFWYPDEPDMAEITLHMVESGDLLRLNLYGREFADYPPLYFWLTSAAGAVGGLHEWVLRLPTMLSAIGLLALTGAWAQRRLGERVALWSVATLGTSYFFVWQATNMHLDMPFAFLLGSAVFAYDLARTAASRGARWAGWCGAAALMGLASLVKGPAGIVLPAGILGADHLLRREWRGVARVAALSVGGAALFAAWAALYAKSSGASNLAYFIFQQNVGRFLTGHSHLRPPHYYFVNIWPGLAPWALFLPLGLAVAWREARRAGNRAIGFALLWFALIFVFFTISRSKRQVYILPLYPMAAVLIGYAVTRLLDAARGEWRLARWLALWPTVLGVLAAGVVCLCALPFARARLGDYRDLMAAGLVAAAVLAAAGVYAVTRLRKQQASRALAAVAVGMGLTYLIAVAWALPLVDDPLSAKADGEWLDQQTRQEAGEVVATFQPGGGVLKEASALTFYGRVPIVTLASGDDVRAFLRRQPNGVVVIEEKKLDDPLLADFERVVARRIQVGSDVLVAIRLRPKKLGG